VSQSFITHVTCCASLHNQAHVQRHLVHNFVVLICRERERLSVALLCLVFVPNITSVVGAATRYELDGPGIESRWGRDFPHPSIPALGPSQPPIKWVPDLFPGVKRPGRGVSHPPPSSTEVKGRVELYLFSPSGPSWPVLRANFTFSYKQFE
jgi:hypothetical protein